MNKNDIMKIVRRTYDEYVQNREYLHDGRDTPVTYDEYKNDLFNRAADILNQE